MYEVVNGIIQAGRETKNFKLHFYGVEAKDGKLNESEGKGIGETGAEKCYDLYKEVNPEIINFKSESFINKASDICMFHKKLKDIVVTKERGRSRWRKK